MSELTDTKTPRSTEVVVEDEAAWKRRLTITVAPGRVASVRRREQRRVTKSVRLKGFRKGKVPSTLVEERYGPLIDERTVTSLIEEAFRDALRQTELQPVGDPTFGQVQYEPGESLTFQVEIEILPELNLERIGGFRIKKPETGISGSEVEEVVERLRTERAVLQPVERGPRDGDVVAVRILNLDEEAEAGATGEDEADRPFRFELGAGHAIPDVEQAILELDPGGSGEFEIGFPDDFDDPELAGGTRKLRIELLDVRAKRLPELDDEFATQVGDFESLDQLRETVREDIQRHHEEEAERAVRDRLVDSIIEANPFEVPPVLIDRYLDRMIEAPEEADAEQLATARRTLSPAVERQIKRQLILERLIEDQELAATPEELEVRVSELAERAGTEPAELRRRLAREKRMDALAEQIATDKAFEFLLSQSTVD